MRKMILLAVALSLALTAVSFSPRAEAAGSYPCQQCTTNEDGSQCCVTCVCYSYGQFTVTDCPMIGCGTIFG